MRGLRPVLFLAAACALAGSSACARAGTPPPTLLVALEPASPGGNPHPRGARVVAVDLEGRTGGERWLTREFWSASAPAVSFDGVRFLFVGRREASDPARLWEKRVDGGRARPLAEGLREPVQARYLPDGRIVSSARGGEAGRSLHVCNADGSGMRRITFGSGDDTDPRVLADGRIAFVRRLQAAREGSEPGSQVWMSVHPDGTGVQRFHGEVPVEEESVPSGWSAPEGYRVTFAAAVRPRPLPRPLTSVVDESRRAGSLLCLDVRESRLPRVAALSPGEALRIRALLAAGAEGARGEGEVAGEAPVESDGSFYLEVPPDAPLRLELIGREGRVLAACGGGAWVRPGENRACIGCHEDPEIAPENRVPRALGRLQASARSGG